MKTSRFLSLFVACLLVLGAALVAVAAKTYVDLKGNFYFNYPDDWVQVDHRIVDVNLAANKAGEATLDYEAAFAPQTSTPFYSGPYFILTVDTVTGGYTDSQIDSILNVMSSHFGEKVKYFPVADFLADLKSNEPVYDAQRKIITVVNDIVEKGQVLKKHLLVEKFFDNGIATFYFYAPVDQFAQAQTIFNDVLDSFHSGDVDSMLPRETLKVANLKNTSGGSGGESSFRRYLPWGILVILIIVIAVARGRKKQ